MLYAPLPNAPSVTSSVKDTQLVSGRRLTNSESVFGAETHTDRIKSNGGFGGQIKLLHDLFGVLMII